MDLGNMVPHKQRSTPSQGMWGKSEFSRVLEEASQKQGMIG